VWNLGLRVHGDEFASLFVCKSTADEGENIFFAHASIFQFDERRAGDGGLTGGAAASDRDDDLIGVACEHDAVRVDGPGTELAEASKFESIGIGDADANQSRDVIAIGEQFLTAPCELDELNTTIVGESRLMNFEQFRDFRIGDIEIAKLLNRV